MAKMVVGKSKAFNFGQRNLAWCNQVDENTFECLYIPTSCRTYMSCFWWHTNKDNTYDLGVDGIKFVPPDPKVTSIFFTTDSAQTMKNAQERPGDYAYYKLLPLEDLVANVTKNLPFLHEKEKKAGIENLTKFVVCSDQQGAQGVVFIGDKVWQSNLWKQTMYTYLLKKITFPELSGKESYTEYDSILKKYGNKLLEKITTEFNETFRNYQFRSVHNDSGFVSICSGVNQPMAKLLLGAEIERPYY